MEEEGGVPQTPLPWDGGQGLGSNNLEPEAVQSHFVGHVTFSLWPSAGAFHQHRTGLPRNL